MANRRSDRITVRFDLMSHLGTFQYFTGGITKSILQGMCSPRTIMVHCFYVYEYEYDSF